MADGAPGHFASASRYARTIDVESGSHTQRLMTSAGGRNALHEGETAATIQSLPTEISSRIVPATRQPHQVDDASSQMERANTLGITLSTGLGGRFIAFAAATDVNQHRHLSRVRDGYRRRAGRRCGRSSDRRHGRIQSCISR